MSILYNEIVFLQHKMKFMYDNFDQLIFIDYNVMNGTNSTDGSIEYIEGYEDPENKIILCKGFDPRKVKKFSGYGNVIKQRMFAEMSKYVLDDIDYVWATDLDEFFHSKLVKQAEKLFEDDPELMTIDVPQYTFVYNHLNYFNKDYLIPPRITRHSKGKLYGHCDFADYGKVLKFEEGIMYHFGFVGYHRCKFKFAYNGQPNVNHDWWLKKYANSVKNNKKYISLPYTNPKVRPNLWSKKYTGELPEYLQADEMCNGLNKL